MALRFPKKNNPLYPLPPDYDSLDKRGQRLARLNACMLQDTPEDLVTAWAYLREYYLFPTPKGQFYAAGVVPSPPFHYQIVHDLAANPLNVWAAVRGGGKSTVLGKEIPLLMLLTRANFQTVLVVSAERFIMTRFDDIMLQITDNERIINDFGHLRPPKGKGIWNHGAIRLTNGSAFYGLPVEGKMLGLRPPLLLFDDAEYDPALVSAPTSKVENFRYMITVVVAPMMEAGTCLGVIGTLHRKDFFLYHMATSLDPQWQYWNRRIINAYDDSGQLTWEEKLSEEFLEDKRRIMGPEGFAAAYMNSPYTTGGRLFRLHPELHQYVLPMSIQDEKDPLSSNAELLSWKPGDVDLVTGDTKTVEVRRPFGKAASKMYRIMLVDYARTVSSISDLSCAIVLGFENSTEYRDCMWVLDLVLGRIEPTTFIRQLLEMAVRWRVKAIGVESTALMVPLADRVETMAAERTKDGWVPLVLPIKVPTHMSKGDRVSSMAWRFNQHLVKLPLSRKAKEPFRELYHQIENATPDLALLKHDDAVDAMAMHILMLRPRHRTDKPDGTSGRSAAADRIMKGQLVDEFGLPLLHAVPTAELTSELLHRVRSLKLSESDWAPGTSVGFMERA